MWAKLIEIIERRWAERRQPRHQLVRHIFTLYSDLTKCNECYLAFETNRSPENLEQWFGALKALLLTFDRVEPMLSIYDETGLRRLKRWVAPHTGYQELIMREVTASKCTSSEEDKLNLERMLEFDGISSDQRRREFGDTFEAAIKDLRGFIRKNFTMEEIFGVD